MISKILVAYDGSEPADKAFDYVLELAGKFSKALEVVGVIRPPDFGGSVESTALIEQGKTSFAEHSRKLHERARRSGIKVNVHNVIRHPGDQIVHFVDEAGVDLIVLGYRGKSAVSRWLTGSTTKQVMSHAHCSVLIVR